MIGLSPHRSIQILTLQKNETQAAELARWLIDIAGIPAISSLYHSQFQTNDFVITLGAEADFSTMDLDPTNSFHLDIPWRTTQNIVNLFEHLASSSHTQPLQHIYDIYLSEGFTDPAILRQITTKENLRLVGPSPAQLGISSENRLENMLHSCSAYLAMLPPTASQAAITRINHELTLAQKIGVPALIFGTDRSGISADLHQQLIWGDLQAAHEDSALVNDLVNELKARWQPAVQPHYSFYATSMSTHHTDRTHAIQSVIEAATQMQCMLGSEIRGNHVQGFITDLVRNSRFVVAHISAGNHNTLIESGIALGAKRDLYLLSQEQKRERPFMLRNQQFWYYQDEVDLLGLVFKISLPYRRKTILAPVA